MGLSCSRKDLSQIEVTRAVAWIKLDGSHVVKSRRPVIPNLIVSLPQGMTCLVIFQKPSCISPFKERPSEGSSMPDIFDCTGEKSGTKSLCLSASDMTDAATGLFG